MTTPTPTRRLHSVLVVDRDGGYLARHWRCTESDARQWYARHEAAPNTVLVGPTGLILARGTVDAV